MDLFDYMRETQQKESPLASRMRPKTLDEGFDASYASDDYEEYMCKPIDIMKFDSLIRKLEIIQVKANGFI